VQIGTPQDITAEEISRIASDANSDYVISNLARAALMVLHKDPPRAMPFDELLDRALNTMVRDGNGNAQPSGLAAGFERKELVFTLVYAMVMSGNQEKAVDALEKHLWSGSRYKHAVVLQALRNIGTQRAIGLIQQFAEKGGDRNLAENTLIDEDYPVLFELHDRWGLVPPQQRTRDQLTAIVKSGCDQRTAMASYWLGFFPPHPDPAQEQAELDALRAVVEKNSPTCEMMEHVIALKSLGLRSPESMEFWASIVRRATDKNVWERHQAMLNAWSRFGLEFAPVALDLLRTEPAQYIQWELMHGNFLTRKHLDFRSTWDVWIPSTLQLYLNSSNERGIVALPKEDVGRLLGWLESGARPQDRWVQNHMLYGLAAYVAGDDTLRFLRLFNTWPQRDNNWWIIDNLRDPAAIPLLRYWSSLPTKEDQARVIHDLVMRLALQQSQSTIRASQCCLPTKACLVRHVNAGPVDAFLQSEADAQQWLLGARRQEGNDPRVTFTDELERIADVELKNGERQHWEYIYDCWHRTGSQPR
jgi:hypothetical protein